VTETGKYLLLDRIALGGMAEIYRAKSLGVEGFERIVVLKRILPQLAEDAEFVQMFVHEAKIAVQLSHANICPIYELGKIGATHFIAMEYVWGRDLREILRRFKMLGQPMPPPMAAWITCKILEALDYAHRKRDAEGRPLAIIHRDISPQNILVSYEGLVKLIDFGIAKAAGRATQTQAGVIKGKLGYMSPEQIMGRPIDHRSDIFATSGVLHEALTGEKLFSGNNDIEIIDKVRQADVPPPSSLASHVPPQLDQIVLRGLARDPNDRYQTAGEMQEALMYYIASMRPPFGTSALSRWMKAEFQHEMNEERAHLEKLSSVAQPGQSVAASKPRAAAPVPEHFEEVSGMVEEVSMLLRVDEVEASIAIDMPDLDAIAPRESAAPEDPLAQFEPEPESARQAPKVEAWHEESVPPPEPTYAEVAQAPVSQPPPDTSVRHSLKATMAFSAFVPPAGSPPMPFAPPQAAQPMPSQLQRTAVALPAFDPASVSSPGISSPGISNPGISSPGISNPGISNPGTPMPAQLQRTAVSVPAFDPASVSVPGDSHPGTASPSSPGMPSQLQHTGVGMKGFDPASVPPGMIKPPSLPPPALSSPGTVPAPSGKAKKSKGWIYALVFLFLLLAAGGGAAVWIFRFGGRALLGI
jgi:serine/threonine protein kinase